MFSTTTRCRPGQAAFRLALTPLFLLLVSLFSAALAQPGVSTTRSFSYTGQIETFTAPAGVTSLTIEARGGEGGGMGGSTAPAGKGAIVGAQVSVTPGQSLSILVGQYLNGRAAGGGGTFVVGPSSSTTAPTPLAIAGGGGGSSLVDSPTKHGQTTTSGGTGGDSGGGAGGGTGAGGGAGAGAFGGGGGGGGGLLGNGSGTGGGKSFVNGGAGGTGYSSGAFGGGGEGSGGGGGGGGYSGGGGGDRNGGVGGGGGSFTAGTQLFARTGATDGNSGNGLVTITYVLPTQPIRYVKQGGSGTGDGTSWANASGDLQSQIDIAGARQVWVAQGTYKPGPAGNTDQSISFVMKNGVAIYGGFPPDNSGTLANRNPASFTTVLSGDIDGDGTLAGNSLHVFFNVDNGLNSTAVLDGFIITAGNAPGYVGDKSERGAGMCNVNASPTLVNLIFINNSAVNYGGAVYAEGNGNSRFINCAFSQNGQTAVFGYLNSTINLVNCTFSQNSGGAIDVTGGSTANLTNCILWSNGGPGAFDGAVTANYCLIGAGEVNYSGTGNVTATTSPFVSGTSLTLNPCSPAINAGDPNSTTATSGSTDLAGNPRFYQNGRIDIGAYEYQGTPSQPVAITQQPVSGSSVCVGSTVTAMVMASGTSPAYQWYKDGLVLTGIASATTATLTLTNVQTGDAGSYSVVVTGSCNSVTSTPFSLTVTNPQPPTLATQPGQAYPAGVSSLTAYQNTGDVVLMTSGCAGGTITWAGGMATTLAVSTVSTGVQTFTATCQQNGCVSPTATATVTVLPTNLKVLQRDPDNGQLNTNTLKPYLQLENDGTTPVPYGQLTVRYWLTVENPGPLHPEVNYAQLGTDKVHIRYVALPRQGATGYLEYSFDGSAGSLAAMSNSGDIQNSIRHEDYSSFNQGDDYSYVLNRDFALNAHITAYIDGQIVWGQEPPGSGSSTPVNQPPVATGNSNQMATVGQQFTYTVNAFTDDTPNSLTYTASISPANNLMFNPATRMIQGTPQSSGVSSVTITATDPGGLSASTTFTITVNPAPVVTPVRVVFTANPTMLLTTGTTTLSATASGGTPGYTYAFSGPGTIAPNGNTAQVSNLPTGVQTFTVVVSDVTSPVSQTVSATVSVTVSAPVNQPPVATANTNQTATVGQAFTYTVNAFTDDTPNSLTYTATINPANGLTFNPATRVIQGIPINAGVSSVTITATDPGGLSASTVFTITVNPAPVVTDRLTVLSRDPENGTLNTNTLKPYLLLQNDGTTAIPYGELTVRYYLTLENPVPLRFDINYAQVGNDKVHLRYVPLSPARQGATGYIEFSFDGSAGSLTAGNNTLIQDQINKQDYSMFFQGDDYSYVNNGNFTPNPHITAYRNGVLIYGAEPPSATRMAAPEADQPLTVVVLGNPVSGSELTVDVRGAEGQALRFQLTDITGRLVGEQQVERADTVERQSLPVGHQPAGLLLLRVSTPTQSQTVKVLKR